MGKLRVWSVVLLGMSMAGVSGLSLARNPPGGPGGYVKPAPSVSAGSYSKPRPVAPRAGGASGPVRPDSFHKPPPPDYHRPSGSYHRPWGGYYHPNWHDDDDWYFSLYLSPFYWPWYYTNPYYYPGPYYPPYYYPPGVMTVPATPQEYIEREDDAEAAPPPSAYWYYCSDPRGYYPDVQQCNVDWRPVAPRPPEAPTDGRSP